MMKQADGCNRRERTDDGGERDKPQIIAFMMQSYTVNMRSPF